MTINEKKFSELVKIMKTLRSENGCPWDKEQTIDSIRPYLVEETYEVLDALDKGDPLAVKEELGDLLLQIIFQAQLWEEEEKFTIYDVIENASKKMIARHPHVFGDAVVKNSAEVLNNWEKLKQKEQSHKKKSILAGVPRNMPALLMAQRVQEKVSRVGFDWEDIEGVWNKIAEELDEVRETLEKGDENGFFEEFGDLMFAYVNLTRVKNINAENALRFAVNKFINRFQKMEKLIEEQSKVFSALSLKEMDLLWEEVKRSSTFSANKVKS